MHGAVWWGHCPCSVNFPTPRASSGLVWRGPRTHGLHLASLPAPCIAWHRKEVPRHLGTEGREGGSVASPVWQSCYQVQNPYPLHEAPRTQQKRPALPPLLTPTPISMLQAKTSRFPAALGPLSLTCRLCSCFHLSGTFSFTLANQSSTTQPSTPCTRTPSLPHWAPEQPLPTPCFWEQSPAASWAFLWAKFRIYLCRGRRSFIYTTFSDWFFCNSVICGVEGGCTHMLTRESFAEQVTSSS